MFKALITVRAVVAGIVAVGLVGAVGPMVAAGADVPPGRVQHEYKFVYTDPSETLQMAVPQPPPGVTYVKWNIISEFSSVGEPTGVLLRSDGRMVGLGELGLMAVAAIERGFGNAKIRDFTGWGRDGAYLIFADGTVGMTEEMRQRAYFDGNRGNGINAWAGPWNVPGCDNPAGVRFVRFISGSLENAYDAVLLRSDGRVAVFHMARDSGQGKALSKTCQVTGRAGYVDGTVGEEPRPTIRDWMIDYKALLRADGRVDIYDDVAWLVGPKPKGPVAKRLWGDNPLPPRVFVPRLPKGVKYVDLAASGESVLAYLRSDGKMVYRGGVGNVKYDVSNAQPVKQQPPTLPVGLKYVSLDGWYDSWIVLRSDGQAVILNGGYTYKRGKAQTEYKRRPKRVLPKLDKGWQYVSGMILEDQDTVFLVERITPGQKVATGIEKIKTPKSIRKGKTAKITVTVASRAILDGGTVKVTHKGKAIGKAKVKGTKAVIKIKTKTMKSKGKNTIGVQYLGNTQGKKSTKAKGTLTTRS